MKHIKLPGTLCLSLSINVLILYPFLLLFVCVAGFFLWCVCVLLLFLGWWGGGVGGMIGGGGVNGVQRFA